MGCRIQFSTLTALLFLVGCRPPTTTLDQGAVASLQAQVNAEIQRLIAESCSRAAQNDRYGVNEFPNTSPEEIQRGVSAGAAYVVTRISNGQAVFVLLSEIEYSQLRPGFVSYGMNKVELINPYC